MARFEPANGDAERLRVRILKIATQIEAQEDVETDLQLPALREGGFLPIVDWETGESRPYELMRPRCMRGLPDVQLDIQDMSS